ncbi:MAG TPA: response regulator transcription factor [Deinococcales bacterium]|nr:response regulator transcription factor [Deinococcales bacterium]
MERLLVIDDDPAVTSLLRRGLTFEGFAVDVAASGPEGLALARDRLPDLVILDWMMPGLDGLEVLRRLRAVSPALPVVMLTARDAVGDEVAGLQAGADDYVPKPFTFDVLVARVHALLRRQRPDRPVPVRFADLTLDPQAHRVARRGREITLTNLEFRLLQLLLENPERVFSKELLLDRVWGSEFFGSSNVVEVYVKQVRQKLEQDGEPRLIHTLRGVGYVLRER